MRPLEDLFGSSPRVKVLEAALWFGDTEFSAVDMAHETGLHKPTAYRIVRALEKEKLFVRTTRTRPVRYRINVRSPKYQMISYLEAALGLVSRAENGNWTKDEVVEILRNALRREISARPS
ncbi:MAG: helix-turn-helix domain-containing protein [Euryarchaeota archaeon]|nr:helix-turn-helix domain-containing protein [Euryarchaeota archaeon]